MPTSTLPVEFAPRTCRGRPERSNPAGGRPERSNPAGGRPAETDAATRPQLRFPAPLFDIVLKGLTIRGSIVGTRQDRAEALDFDTRGLIHPTVRARTLDEVNEVLGEMKQGKIDGRVVIEY